MLSVLFWPSGKLTACRSCRTSQPDKISSCFHGLTGALDFGHNPCAFPTEPWCGRGQTWTEDFLGSSAELLCTFEGSRLLVSPQLHPKTAMRVALRHAFAGSCASAGSRFKAWRYPKTFDGSGSSLAVLQNQRLHILSAQDGDQEA